jgi:hypothetical protein
MIMAKLFKKFFLKREKKKMTNKANNNTATNTTIEFMLDRITAIDDKLVEKNHVARKQAFLATKENVVDYLGSLYGAEISQRQLKKILRGIKKTGTGIPQLVPVEMRERIEGADTWFVLSNGDAFCVSEEKTDILKSIFSKYWEQHRTVRYLRGGVALLAEKAEAYAVKKRKVEKLSEEHDIPEYILSIFGPEWAEELKNMKVRFADDERREVKSDLTSFFDFEAIPWLHRKRALDLVNGSAFTSQKAKRHFCRVIRTVEPALSWNISKWLWAAKCQCH